MRAFSESVVEEAALAWLETAGWQIRNGSEIAPGEARGRARRLRAGSPGPAPARRARAAQPGAAGRGAGRCLPQADAARMGTQT
jgi:hypothetical protein